MMIVASDRFHSFHYSFSCSFNILFSLSKILTSAVNYAVKTNGVVFVVQTRKVLPLPSSS